MILRRGLLASLLLPSLAHAQRRLARIGILSPGQLTVDLNRATLVTELGKAGYIEGRGLEIIGRSSDGDLRRIPGLAAALVALQPDVIVAVSNPVALAIRAVNPTLPIVMSFAGSDPIADGLASSLARPGGSVTGIVMLAEELDVKRVELALEAFPGATRIGLLAGSSYPADRIARLTAAARRLGTELVTVRAEGPESFARAFASLVELRAHAVLISASPGLPLPGVRPGAARGAIGPADRVRAAFDGRGWLRAESWAARRRAPQARCGLRPAHPSGRSARHHSNGAGRAIRVAGEIFVRPGRSGWTCR